MTRTMQAGDLCLVTGVSGYLASWIAKDLLAAGFRVRGTVRSLADLEKVGALRALFPDLEFAQADLRAADGWAAAVEGCRWVFHVASPQAVASETDRTGGAVQGTGHLMRAALASCTVEKVVLTSSEAAIAYGHPRSKQRFDEDDWTDLEGPAGAVDYFRSKTLAEKLAWDLAGDLSGNPRGMALTTVCPGFILGPSLVPWGRYSLESLRATAQGKAPVALDMVTHMVDVRDCAAMHIALMNDPTSDGRRHFSFSVAAKMTDMAASVRRQYGSRGFSPRPWVVPTAVLGALSLVSRSVGAIHSKLGHPNLYETKWPQAYRYAHTDLDALVRDSMDSMLAHGWLGADPTTIGRGNR